MGFLMIDHFSIIHAFLVVFQRIERLEFGSTVTCDRVEFMLPEIPIHLNWVCVLNDKSPTL